MTDNEKMRAAAGVVVQKILDALGIEDVNINSRGLFEDWVCQAGSAWQAAQPVQRQRAVVEKDGSVTFTPTQQPQPVSEDVKMRLAQIASGDYKACGLTAEEVAKDALAAIQKGTGHE